MARKKVTSTLDVTGLSVNDIMDMDINDIVKLNRGDLSKLASRMVSASNKRLRRLANIKGGKYSPSYISAVSKKHPQFSIKGKNRNQILNEMKRMRNFMQSKTSSVSGYKKVIKNTEKRIGVTFTPRQWKNYWKVYNKLVGNNANLFEIIKDSDRIQELLANDIKQKTFDENTFITMLEEMAIDDTPKRKKRIRDLSDAFSTDFI